MITNTFLAWKQILFGVVTNSPLATPGEDLVGVLRRALAQSRLADASAVYLNINLYTKHRVQEDQAATKDK